MHQPDIGKIGGDQPMSQHLIISSNPTSGGCVLSYAYVWMPLFDDFPFEYYRFQLSFTNSSIYCLPT